MGSVNAAPQQTVAAAVSVSVIIPTLNRSRLLREVLESLFAQTMDSRRFEIIVVDNASSDDTPAMIEELQGHAPCRLRYHRFPEDRGPARARNQGVRLAQGELLAFTDSDCRVERDWLEKGVAALGEDVALVTGSVLHKPGQRVRFFSGMFPPVTEENPTYPTCNSFYRRQVYSEMNGMDESLCFSTFLDNKPVECADTDLAWRIKERGGRSVFLRDLVVYHEVPVKKPLPWILDTYRLYVLPALVKKHPQLRASLLHLRLFFQIENFFFYLLVAGVVLGLTAHWIFLALALVYPARVAYVLRENLTPLKLPKLALQTVLLALRQAVCCAGLVYGSLRFRCLVL